MFPVVYKTQCPHYEIVVNVALKQVNVSKDILLNTIVECRLG